MSSPDSGLDGYDVYGGPIIRGGGDDLGEAPGGDGGPLGMEFHDGQRGLDARRSGLTARRLQQYVQGLTPPALVQEERAGEFQRPRVGGGLAGGLQESRKRGVAIPAFVLNQGQVRQGGGIPGVLLERLRQQGFRAGKVAALEGLQALRNRVAAATGRTEHDEDAE
jgi:hypothetical protein